QIGVRLAGVMNLAISPFYYAVYPELSKLVAANNRPAFIRLLWTSALIVGGVSAFIWLAFALFGKGLIAWALGPSYEAAFSISLLCMMGMVAWGASQPLSPALFSLGLARRAFHIHMSVAIVYFVALAPLILTAGLYGAGIAYALLFV